jgi:putative membrane protein
MRPPPAVGFDNPSRRTYLASERTLLAWWRTAFGAIGVAVGVGRLLPDVAHLPKGPFVALGVGWAILAALFIVYGTQRQRLGLREIEAGGFRRLGQRSTLILGAYMLLLTAATAATLFWRA